MVDTQPEHAPSFLKEVWILFGVGAAVLALRFVVRSRIAGVRGFQGDDYMSIVVFLCYLVDAVTVTYTYYYGTNVDFTIERLETMSDAQLHQIKLGSQLQLLAWYTYTGLIWALKACMLFFFNRLTFGLGQQRWVKILGWVVGITYIVVFLTISVGCHPIQKNYQVLPYPGDACAVKEQNFYVSTVLNVITDAAILVVPMPLLFRLQAPFRKKIALATLLSSGIFVITAALVRIIMTLSANASAVNINRWGVRETIAGIIAVNIPVIKPIFSKAFWQGNIPGVSGHSSSSHPSRKGDGTGKSSIFDLSNSTNPYGSQTGGDGGPKSKTADAATYEIDDFSSRNSDAHAETGSQEMIIQRPTSIHRTGSYNDSNKKQSNKNSSHDADLERDASEGSALTQIGGVMIEKTYDVRPQSEDPREGFRDGDDDDSGQRGLWRPDLKGRQGYGNHIHIGSGR